MKNKKRGFFFAFFVKKNVKKNENSFFLNSFLLNLNILKHVLVFFLMGFTRAHWGARGGGK